MTTPLLFLAVLAASFLIGSFPTAYLAGRYLRGIDLRNEGSGNVGATNAVRVMGKGIGYSVFLLDLLKGFLPVFILSRFIDPSHFRAITPENWIGLAAIFGHIFSPFLKFKGGKGIAVGAGVVCAINVPFFLVSISLWALTFLATKYVSVSSLVAVLSLPVLSLLSHHEVSSLPFFALLFAIAVWTHRENIRRLLKGEESSFR